MAIISQIYGTKLAMSEKMHHEEKQQTNAFPYKTKDSYNANDEF
jgi:hypothetical protein